MPVNFIAVASRESAVDAAIKENEAFHDVNVVMEVFGVQDEDIFAVCHVVASGLDTVEVLLAEEGAQLVGTRGVFRDDVETLVNLRATEIAAC